MIPWIIIGIIAFILFITSTITLFFPRKRIIGAIVVVIAMTLFVVTVVGIIITFNHYQKVNENVARYATSKDNKRNNSGSLKEYKLHFIDKKDDVEIKIPLVKVEKKKTYSSLAGKEVPGKVTVMLIITNHANKTLKTYPNQGELKTPKETVNGGDALLSDFPDSEVKPKKTIKGKLVFPLSSISEISDVKWISLSWISYLGEERTLQHETDKIDLK